MNNLRNLPVSPWTSMGKTEKSVRTSAARRLPSLALFAGLLLLLSSSGAQGEFYNYVDKNGTHHLIDDVSKIPQEYRQRTKIYREDDDGLSDSERKAQREKQRLQQQKEAHREAERSEALRQQQRQAEWEEYLRTLVTPVYVTGNRVFLKVTLAYGNQTTDAFLLLDTGASVTLITPSVAERLKIKQGGEDTMVAGVGGRVSRAQKAVLSEVTVGPSSRKNLGVVIIGDRGNTGYGDGLLGMDFLRGFTYKVDFAKQVIIWSPQALTQR